MLYVYYLERTNFELELKVKQVGKFQKHIIWRIHVGETYVNIHI